MAANRQLLSAQLGVGPVQWLQQVHGTEVFTAQFPMVSPAPVADALYTSTPELPIAVLTADCPAGAGVFSGDEIAAAHAGWRGLAQEFWRIRWRRFAPRPSSCWSTLAPPLGLRTLKWGGGAGGI